MIVDVANAALDDRAVEVPGEHAVADSRRPECVNACGTLAPTKGGKRGERATQAVTREPDRTIRHLIQCGLEPFPDRLDRLAKSLVNVADVPRLRLQQHITEQILPGVWLRSPERDDREAGAHRQIALRSTACEELARLHLRT